MRVCLAGLEEGTADAAAMLKRIIILVRAFDSVFDPVTLQSALLLHTYV